MKIALAIAGIAAAVLVIAGMVLYVAGRLQPERHTATLTFAVPKSRAVVWAALTDYAAMPQWWPAVKSVRAEKKPNGEILTWNTDSHGREIAFRTREEQPPTKLVREIVGPDLPFGGIWTYTLAEENGGTRITLVEDGFIKPPLFRAVARYFIGLDATLKDFARHFAPYASGK